MKGADDGDGKKGRKKKGIAVDEDAVPIRQEARKFIEGKFITILMQQPTFSRSSTITQASFRKMKKHFQMLISHRVLPMTIL